MAIYIGADLRIVAKRSSWRVEERKIAKDSGVERWESRGWYESLHSAFQIGLYERSALAAAGDGKDVVQCAELIDALSGLALALGGKCKLLCDLAWCELKRRWEALGVDAPGLTTDLRAWSDDDIQRVYSALKGDPEVEDVIDAFYELHRFDDLMQKAGKKKGNGAEDAEEGAI